MMEPYEMYTPLLERVLSGLKGLRKGLHGWVACCPAHADRRPSLSIGLGKEGCILLHCFAGCELESIVSALGLTVNDLFPASTPSKRGRTRRGGLSLLDLAEAKMLPWKFLFNLGILDEPSGGVRIPYYLPDGSPAPRYRLRTALVAKEGSRWNQGSGDILPYGLERLAQACKEGYLILPEGETDSWTLWFHKLPALGIPGAEMVKTLKQEYLTGIERLYVIQEPDAAGASFAKQVAALLADWQWSGSGYAVSLPDAKDPSDLHLRDWKAFPTVFKQALDQARPIWQPPTPPAAAAIGLSNPAAPFSLQTLLAAQFATSHWVVRDLLPEGLLLLGGKPKQGKSWLALALALAIAGGGLALETYQATRGEVLYLALEDTERRLQERLKLLLVSSQEIPTGIEFALAWPRLDQEGLSQLETYIHAHPQLRAIIIDTWAKCAPRAKGGSGSQYADEYSVLAPLKRLAETSHLAILLIHHLRKTGAQDVLDEITGSTGMVGAVDAILVLKRERGQQQASLFVTGRDIAQERFIPLIFDARTACWHVDSTAQEQNADAEAEL